MLKARLRYALLVAISLLLFLFYHNFFFFYILCVTVVLPFVSLFCAKSVWSALEVKPKVNLASVGPGNTIPVKFVINNKTPFPLAKIQLDFVAGNGFYPNEELQRVILPVRRGENEYEWQMTSVYVGNAYLKTKTISCSDYLGLFHFEKELHCDVLVPVIPAPDPVAIDIFEASLVQGQQTEGLMSLSTEDVTQIKEFRPYREGDRPQRVNWKISAKHDELYVKEFEREYTQSMVLLLEIQQQGEKIGFLDNVITAFFSVCTALIEDDVRFEIRAYDKTKNEIIHLQVNDNDAFYDALENVYNLESYEGGRALELEEERLKNHGSRVIYFTASDSPETLNGTLLGIYKERVAIICL